MDWFNSKQGYRRPKQKQSQYQCFQGMGDFLSGVTSILRSLLGVRFRLLILMLAETERDLDRASFSRASITLCLGVMFSFSLSLSSFLRRGLGLIPSVTSGWLKASSQLILSSSFRIRHRRMKSFEFWEMEGSKEIFLLLMPLMSCSSLLAGQGVNPCSSSQQMSPTDHRSDLFVYFWWLRIWGDMQSGVPTMDCRTVLSPCYRLRAKPKSLILSLPLLMSMLAGFRSRCVMSRLFMYSKPLRISFKNGTASSSGIRFFFLRQPRRSPSGQYSVMMYMLLLVWKTSMKRTMLSCSIFFMMSISLQMFLRLYWLAKMRFSMTFTAAGASLLIWRPRKTEAKDPRPSRWFMEQTYFQMRFSPSERARFRSTLVIQKQRLQQIQDQLMICGLCQLFYGCFFWNRLIQLNAESIKFWE